MKREMIFEGGEVIMLGAGRRKWLMELRSARGRREHGAFIVEGNKAVMELTGLFNCRLVVATRQWIERHSDSVAGVEMVEARHGDMERISSLSNPPEVVGVFDMPYREFKLDMLRGRLVVALDGVQDPGNLGSIIRSCDWYGVDMILCSRDTVDVYNAKVIQSTMGAIGRVAVYYVDLEEVLEQVKGCEPVYGTYLEGKPLFDAEVSREGIIVMGNEGHGISAGVGQYVDSKVYIEPYPADVEHVESLNVSVATAITLSVFRHGTSKRSGE